MTPGTALLIVLSSLGLGMSSCSSAPPTSTNGQTDSQPTASAATPCPAPSPDPSRKIVIVAPCDGARVAPRHFVEGVVADSSAQVWVIIHPMEGADYWVQPKVTVRDGGKWKVLCYFGEPGSQHSGKHFEVMALANPKESLKEGQLFSSWPSGESKSPVIEVVRE